MSSLLAFLGFAIVCVISVRSSAAPQCACRAAGQSYAMGTCTCIDRPGVGPEFACCEMVLNNTSWRFTGKSCPVANTEPANPEQKRGFAWDDFKTFSEHSAHSARSIHAALIATLLSSASPRLPLMRTTASGQ